MLFSLGIWPLVQICQSGGGAEGRLEGWRQDLFLPFCFLFASWEPGQASSDSGSLFHEQERNPVCTFPSVSTPSRRQPPHKGVTTVGRQPPSEMWVSAPGAASFRFLRFLNLQPLFCRPSPRVVAGFCSYYLLDTLVALLTFSVFMDLIPLPAESLGSLLSPD